MKRGRFTFQIAGPGHRAAILELRTSTYGQELAYGSEATRWDSYDERAFHLLVSGPDGCPVATMRILGPSSRPFEMETSMDLAPFLRPMHPAAEITRFCIAAAYRRIPQSLPIHAGLIRLLYDSCRQNGIDDVFICAKPTARKLYEFVLYEALTGPVIKYAPLGGDPHLLMRLHIPSLPQLYIESNHVLKAAFMSPPTTTQSC